MGTTNQQWTPLPYNTSGMGYIALMVKIELNDRICEGGSGLRFRKMKCFIYPKQGLKCFLLIH